MQLTWSEIARMLGISRMTLYKRRMELGLTERYTTISDGLLVEQVLLIKKSMPQSGERIIRGVLHSHGTKVQRWRLRAEEKARDEGAEEKVITFYGDEYLMFTSEQIYDLYKWIIGTREKLHV